MDTGLRRTELATIKLAEVNIDVLFVKVESKGGDEDLVPFGGTTARDLGRYRRLRARQISCRRLWLA